MQNTMRKHIINAFLKSRTATETNKNNLIKLISKIVDTDTKMELLRKIQPSEKDSTLE